MKTSPNHPLELVPFGPTKPLERSKTGANLAKCKKSMVEPVQTISIDRLQLNSFNFLNGNMTQTCNHVIASCKLQQ